MRLPVPSLTVLVVALIAGCSERSPAPAVVRVVSLHDVTTELVVALGAADRLVGVEAPVDVPPAVATALARIPRVGDLESVLAARPTVVVGLQIVAAKDPVLVARLREAGIDVWLGEPATLDDVYGLTRAVGGRIGAAAEADRLARTLALRAVASAPRARRPRVFVFDCCDPPFTAGGQTVMSDLIARAGGDNVFADVAAAWTHVSWEQVVARRPELIVIDAYAYAGQGDVADTQRAVQAIPGLAAVPTLTMPLGDALGGIRSLDGLARLRAALGAM